MTKYRRGQRVLVDVKKAVPVTNLPPEEVIEGKISNVHELEKNEYDITTKSGEFEVICSDDAIVGTWNRTCQCGTEVVWHDKKKIYVCPFCEL